jgi:hypothetical protein
MSKTKNLLLAGTILTGAAAIGSHAGWAQSSGATLLAQVQQQPEAERETERGRRGDRPAGRPAPGGEPQRREAFKLGVNATLYAVTANYKKDQIHIHFIRERTS